MNKPNFIVAGAQKSGTTYIWSILKQHPNIFVPEKKEINFYNTSATKDFDKGKYLELFNDALEYQIKGEASPRYIFYSHVPKMMYELNPNLKLIFILRNPIVRAESHYLHNVRDGVENLSFEKALQEEDFRINKDAFSLRAYSYVSRGLYAKQLKEYFKYFPREQILILKFEDFMKNKQKGFKEIHSFLGTSNFNYEEKKSNKNERKYIKYRWLNNIYQNQFAKVCSKFFSRDTKDKIKNSIKKLNTTQNTKKLLDNNSIEYIKKKTIHDIEELEKITGWNLEDWKLYV
ncbi:MAG: sulfotransferase domain-containing protein [Campylobacterota bacterium]